MSAEEKSFFEVADGIEAALPQDKAIRELQRAVRAFPNSMDLYTRLLQNLIVPAETDNLPIMVFVERTSWMLPNAFLRIGPVNFRVIRVVSPNTALMVRVVPVIQLLLVDAAVPVQVPPVLVAGTKVTLGIPADGAIL